MSNKSGGYFTLAAKQNNPFAEYNLAWCYENGKGVEQNLEKAAYWFEKAAIQGDVTAQLYIGNYYFTGCAVRTAFPWM